MKPIKIIYFTEIDSTNEQAKILSYKLENFSIIIAETQTSGKGRNNRKWYSPPNENLYFSIFLKPDIEIKSLTCLPIITGYSVFKTLKNFIQKKIFIKWPNDILIENRKISGILIENYKGCIIIGIGLNVNGEKFPELTDNIPTSLKIETGKFFDRLFILNTFYKNFYESYKKFVNIKEIPHEILNEINDNLYLKNERVTIEFNNRTENGKIIGVCKDGTLKLNNNIIYAGDVKKVIRR